MLLLPFFTASRTICNGTSKERYGVTVKNTKLAFFIFVFTMSALCICYMYLFPEVRRVDQVLD